jgi:hypothetical protein
MPIPLRADFDAGQLRCLARRTKDAPQARRLLALAAIYDGGTRTEAAKIGGGDPADRSRLGDEVQRPGAGRADRPKAARPAGEAERHAPRGIGGDDRERPDHGDPRRRALAACRSVPVDVGRISRQHRQADHEPGIASHGLPETVCPSAPSRAGRGRDRRV